MAQNREKGGRVVFIGNIPYGVSEEQICDIFARIGAVLSFRLVYDKETGKPKGFGFLEYGDVDAAASAVRNLNGFEIMGRELKVDYSNDNGGGNRNNQNQGQGQQGGMEGGRAPPPAHFSMPSQYQANGAPPPQPENSSALPPLPPGIDLPPGLQAPDAISTTMSAIPAPQLLDILSQMKSLAVSEPQKATQLLASAPQLSFAIFQALLLLGLVDTSIVGSLIQQQQQQTTAPLPIQPQQQPPLPPQMPSYPPQQPPPPQQQAAYPPQPPPQPYAQPQPPYLPYQQPQPQPHPGYAPTPPAQQMHQQPPPPPQQSYYQAPPQAHPQAQAPNQDALIQQVLAMTREQIFSLADGPRGQILQLREQLGAPVV